MSGAEIIAAIIIVAGGIGIAYLCSEKVWGDGKNRKFKTAIAVACSFLTSVFLPVFLQYTYLFFTSWYDLSFVRGILLVFTYYAGYILGISFALTVYYKLCNRTRASKYTGIVIYILYVCLFGVSAWADFITGNTITGFACIAAIAVGSVWEVKHNSDFSKEIEVAV